MVFLGGPRQVGKTTFAKGFLRANEGYLSWDDLADRALLRGHSLPDHPLLVIDEVHKYARWRTLLKGFYDKHKEDTRVLVTGSARLDQFRKGGDSLFGRYHYFRMHPFSLPELTAAGFPDMTQPLLRFGGFPEPLLKADETFAKVWRRERIARVVGQDLRDLTQLKDYTYIEVLADALPARVGSPLSFNSLGEDLDKSPHTIESWIRILESVYVCFLVAPYGPPRMKTLKKQKKLYLWDWSVVSSEGARLENMVASHLLKYCHYREDVFGDKMELRYLRDSVGRELDFIVLKDGKPQLGVEVKTGDRPISAGTLYLSKRLKAPKIYQVHLGTRDQLIEGVRILPFHKFCQEAELV